MPRNVAKIVFDDGTVQIVTPDPEPIPAPPPPAGIIKGTFIDPVPDNAAAAFMIQFGMSWVRLWHPIRDWSKPPALDDPTFLRAQRLEQAGIKTLVVFTPIERDGTNPAYPSAPLPSTVYNYFIQAARASRGVIDAWEIFNEPNLSQYNPDYNKLAVTVSNVLKPAYTALKDEHQFVVGASWSGECNTDPFRYFVKNGYFDTCDVVGYHPYGQNATQQIARLEYMRSLTTKPIWLTEWNLHMDQKNPDQWLNELFTAAEGIRANKLAEAVFHFRMVKNDSRAGVAAPFAVDYAQRVPWYDGTKRALSALT